LAAGLGPRLASGRRVALATTVIFSGVSIASVLGVPLGTLVADQWGWRTAFWGLAVLGALTAVLLFMLLPALPAPGASRVARVFAPLRTPGVLFGIVITTLLVLGHFTGYTYIRPFLETESGMGATGLATVLFVYGIAGVAGNFILGTLAGKKTRAAVVLAVGGVAVATLLLATGLGQAAVIAGVVMVLWGFCYGGLSVSTQTWIAKADPAQIEASSALWSGAFNASIAGGAVLGAVTVDGANVTWAMWLAAAVSALALLIAVTTRPHPFRAKAAGSSHGIDATP
ncbi:MAG: MFS transporter, partial [Arachnia sp.]